MSRTCLQRLALHHYLIGRLHENNLITHLLSIAGVNYCCEGFRTCLWKTRKRGELRIGEGYATSASYPHNVKFLQPLAASKMKSALCVPVGWSECSASGNHVALETCATGMCIYRMTGKIYKFTIVLTVLRVAISCSGLSLAFRSSQLGPQSLIQTRAKGFSAMTPGSEPG